MALVPHIYRQEMMPTSETSYYHENKDYKIKVNLDVNESPINLFDPDRDKFFTVGLIEHFYLPELSAGDCVYIPAFYFYQLYGLADTKP